VNDDLEIRKRFVALRDEDRARTPGFEEVLRRARPKPYVGLRVLAPAACLVVAAAIVTVFHTSPDLTASAPGVADPSLAHWRAPTDFLLDTPGRELLYAVPRIGEADALDVFPNPHSSPQRPTGQEPPS
jgi:hypothetical protein